MISTKLYGAVMVSVVQTSLSSRRLDAALRLVRTVAGVLSENIHQRHHVHQCISKDSAFSTAVGSCTAHTFYTGESGAGCHIRVVSLT
jgi:hypothetical protein